MAPASDQIPTPRVDTARVRGLYTTLSPTVSHLDGGYDVLMPESVIRAIGASLRSSPAQPGSVSAGSRWSTAAADAARVAVADLVGGDGARVALAATLPELLRLCAWRLSRGWQLGDEIVLTRLDHDRNVAPWVAAARAVGATVRVAEVDVETGELPAWQYEQLLGPHTRLVVLPVAGPVTGAVVPVRSIADAAHDAGALVVADATAALPHVPLDLDQLGLDGLALSLAGIGGPSMGALAASGPLWQALIDGRRRVGTGVDRSSFVDVGPLPVELLAGVPAVVEHLASLADPDDPDLVTGTRRARVQASLAGIAATERALYARLVAGLEALPGVTVIRSEGPRIPVLGLAVAGRTPDEVGEELLARGVSVWTGATGVEAYLGTLGVDEIGGVCVVGLMPYTSALDVNRLLLALGEYTAAA
ncbi:aminotransferase class V-fold PLP-dependent enzyme [Jatrophihabitans sp. YIM 134969]